MFLPWNQENVLTTASYLLQGDIVSMPSDTIYGLLALANDKNVVASLYALKGRQPEKPFIILISKYSQLKALGISPSLTQTKFLKKYWPGAVSVILSCQDLNLEFLHRCTNSLAVRMPNNKLLKDLIDITGPLIAPSCNPEGLPPATNPEEAKKYFGNKIKLYVDGGDIKSNPSTLVSLLNSSPIVLRGSLPTSSTNKTRLRKP